MVIINHSSKGLKLENSFFLLFSATVIIGYTYCDYLGTRPKNSHRSIIVTGR